MINIAWMLFVGWFLNLFGFGHTVIAGMGQLTGIEITMASYYLIFAAAGLIKNILSAISHTATVELNKKYVDELKDILDKK